MPNVIVVYLDPSYTKYYINHKHPVDMKDAFRKETGIGGAGNIRPPVSAALAFFQLFEEMGGDLMPQRDYVQYYLQQCRDCPDSLEKRQYEVAMRNPKVNQCFEARVYRNFYPSFVDQLHVWGMLAKTDDSDKKLLFDRCIIDTERDVSGKTDLLLYRGTQCITVALRVGTNNARVAQDHKQQFRGGLSHETLTIILPVDDTRKRELPGNKRWYVYPLDFLPLIARTMS